MERKRFSVLFFIKRSKLLKNGEAPVRVRVTYDRLYVELQLKRSIKVPLWSQEKEKSTGKDRNSVELNLYIHALRVKFYQIYQDLELEGKIISARAYRVQPYRQQRQDHFGQERHVPQRAGMQEAESQTRALFC